MHNKEDIKTYLYILSGGTSHAGACRSGRKVKRF